jgi:hypothetical protein
VGIGIFFLGLIGIFFWMQPTGLVSVTKSLSPTKDEGKNLSYILNSSYIISILAYSHCKSILFQR